MRAAVKGLSDRDIHDLAARYHNLSASRSATPATGQLDSKHGADLYLSTCAACHGLRAQGYPQLQTPSLNMLDTWYVTRQMEAFNNGWRGDADHSDQPAVWMRSSHLMSAPQRSSPN